MAVNKNFIVRNGLEVDESLIFADADTQKVGVGTTAPECQLSVVGKVCADTAEFSGIVTASGFFQGAVSGTDINANNLEVSGISTLNNVEINGLLTAGGTTGQADYYLANTGAGITWVPFRENVIDTLTITASEGQSLFTVDYELGLIEVYLNGVRLTDSEFSALTGSTVTLLDPAFEGDTVDFVRYSNAFDFFQLGDINIDTTGIISATSFYGSGANLTLIPYSSLTGITTEIVGDTTPQLGGDLDVNGSDITGTGNINLTGIITATDGFASGTGGPVEISVVGSTLTFNVVGVGSTSLTLI